VLPLVMVPALFSLTMEAKNALSRMIFGEPMTVPVSVKSQANKDAIMDDPLPRPHLVHP
jgi:hypothetical protein